MSKERQQGGHGKEQEPRPYYLAARFPGERLAGRAYFQAQELIFNTPDSDLSVFRIQLNQIYHVAVLGIPPPQELEQKLRSILSTGDSTSLPADILKVLLQRRAQATRQGPWVEKHFRPGQPL